jgi:transposase IS66 family protein
MHDGRGQNHQAYLWQYSRPGGAVIFDFQLSRSREGPKQFLANFNGILQTDGYSGYDRIGGPQLIHAGCWAHARRYSFRPWKPILTIGLRSHWLQPLTSSSPSMPKLESRI